MPVWRPRADWLRQCIESVLAQRDCEFELIVVDDGNSSSRRRIAGLARRSACERSSRTARRSIPRAQYRFTGGNRIPHPLRRRRRCAGGRQHSASADAHRPKTATQLPTGPLCRATSICADMSRRYESTLEGDVSKQFLLGEFDVRHLSMLFPRTIIERTGEWSTDFAVSADRDFVQRALEHGPVRGEQAIATFYRRHRRSIQGQADIASGETAALKVVARYIERHPDEAGSRLHRMAIANILLNRAHAFAHVGMFGSALSRVAKAAAYAPARASRTAAGIAWRRRNS